MFKKLAAIVSGAALVLGFQSCSEEFDVAAPYKNIIVGYGVMNIADTVHYFRIEKAFMDEKTSAYTMAKILDSSFHKNLQVTVKEIGSNGAVLSTATLGYADVSAEIPKDSGIFYNTPNYAYKYSKTLNAGNEYRLIIKDLNTGEVDSAQTNIMSNGANDFRVIEFNSVGYRMKFAKPNGNFQITVKTPVNSRLFQAVMRFKWSDKVVATGTQTDHYFDWNFYYRTPTAFESGNAAGGSFKIGDNESLIPFADFYNVILNGMGTAPTGVERYIDSVDVYIYAGAETMYTYKRYADAAGGITGDQIRPTFTNFKGKDIMGLLSSKSVYQKLSIPFDDETVDSMKVKTILQPVKIRGVSDH